MSVPMRLRTILFIALGVVAVVIVGAVIALSAIDFGQYKGVIVEKVEHATGRKLTIASLKLTFLPVPALALKNVEFGNAEWGTMPQMLKLGRLSAKVAVLPLIFGGDVRVDRLVLKDVELYLETNAKGRGNWELGAPTTAALAQPMPAPKGTGVLELSSFNDVMVQNAVVTYHDGQTRKTTTASLETVKLVGRTAERTSAHSLNFDLTVDGKDLSTLRALAGAPLPTKPYHLAATITGDVNKVIMTKSLQASFGGSSLAGEASLALSDPRPKLTATLNSPMIDLTEFLRPVAAPATRSGSDDRIFSKDPLPLEALRTFDGDVTLNAAEVKTETVTLRNVSAHLTLDDQILQIKPIAVDVTGGHFEGNVDLSARRAPAVIDLNANGKGLDFGRLLAMMSGNDLLEGKADLNVAVRGTGDSVHAFMASLDGASSLVVGRGVIKSRFADLIGADLFREAFAWMQGKKDTKLTCMVMHLDIQKGLATSRGLLIDTEGVTISGKGTVNLGSERLDLQLTPHPKERSLLSLATPIDIGGTFNNPSVQPNKIAMAKEAAMGVVTVINPLVALSPMVFDNGGDQNPCLAALENEKGGVTQKGATQGSSVPKKEEGGIGGAVKDIGRSLDNLFK